MRIALFTPYSPEIGGGSVQLRSHIGQLPDLNVEWYYLAGAPVQGAHLHWLGQSLTAAQLALDLCARSGFLPGSRAAVREIVDQMDADLYWIVAHYEGICVAAELLSRGKAVHLTVHDEPLGMLIRSRRFRVLLPLMARTFSHVLKAAKSVDVTSANMRNYFKRKYNVESFALYKYVPELPTMNFRLSEKTLTVGHIGSLYHPDPFRQFVRACRDYAASQSRGLKIIRIGGSPEMDKVMAENLARFESHGELLEQDALPVLATCDFVYAMYPNGYRFQRFRRTSLPIKLSTYIQAQRPIFAHTPPDSGLAQLVERYGLGKVCVSNSATDLSSLIRELLSMQIGRENFERARSELMGNEQIQKLREALMGAESDGSALT